LVDNAIKFTENGEVLRRPEAGTPVADALPCRISVHDSGIGIPAVQRAMSFQHFTQADSSTTRKHGGTGLGLAICRQLVGPTECRITVGNEEGRGSTFTVEVALPTARCWRRCFPGGCRR
jgi:signal transduction histidine kinase